MYCQLSPKHLLELILQWISRGGRKRIRLFIASQTIFKHSSLNNGSIRAPFNLTLTRPPFSPPRFRCQTRAGRGCRSSGQNPPPAPHPRQNPPTPPQARTPPSRGGRTATRAAWPLPHRPPHPVRDETGPRGVPGVPSLRPPLPEYRALPHCSPLRSQHPSGTGEAGPRSPRSTLEPR